MEYKKLGILILTLIAILATIGAFGHTFTSIPAISQHFSYETDTYWFQRLLVSLILGTTGLHFGVIILWLGLFLLRSKDKSKSLSGQYILFLSILPHVVSFIALPLLTPQDWPHMIIHGLVIIGIPLGLYLRR